MTAPTQVTFPARCAVSIAYNKQLVSQVFPAGIAVEGFFEGMVELVDEDLKRRGFDGVALPPGSYELHKVNGVRLDITRSLDDLGIQDSDTLVLVPAVDGESFDPQIESLSTALAATGKQLGELPEVICVECGHHADEQAVAKLMAAKVERMFAPVTALTAAHTAIAILALAVALTSALALRARTFTDNWVPAAVAGGVGALMVIGAVVVRRGWRERRDLFGGFGWMAVGALAVGTACAPPGPLGAPHAVIGLIIVALGAITLSVLTHSQTAVATGLVTLCAIVAAVGAVRMWQPVSARVLAIAMVLLLLLLIRMTPTIALWVARVRPPYFGSITGRDLFARRDGMPLDTVSPVGDDGEDEDDELTDISARGAAIASAARLINGVQVGICVAVSVVLPAAVWMLLEPGKPAQWEAAALAGLASGIFITQARGFAAKVQAIALVCGACTAVLAGIGKYALAEPGNSAGGLLWPVVAVAVFAGFGVAAGLLVPETKFVPWIRLTVEWLEVVALVAVVVVGAHLGGWFSWIHH